MMSPSCTVQYRSSIEPEYNKCESSFHSRKHLHSKKVYSFVNTSIHTYWILWALKETGFKNFCGSWIPRRGLIWKEMDINRSGPLEIKRISFLFFTTLSLSLSLSLFPQFWALVPEGCRQATDLPSLSLPPSLQSLPLSTPLPSPPSISPSRGAAFRSELMDLRWCMHSHSRIPSSVERRAVSKKKDDMWDWETWLDRSETA